MNLNHLRVFYESACTLNFSRAAERLYISQPAVSSQIRQLEEMLKLKLFNRIGNKVYLTESGKVLLDYAQKIFTLEHEAKKVLNEIKETRKGTLRIGTTKTYARYLMPNYISTFHELYPEVCIHLSEGSSTEMMQSLFNMKNEFAIVASTDYPKFLNSIAFGHEEIPLVASPDHLLARRSPITTKELANIPLVMREEGSVTRQIVMEMLKKINLSPIILFEASNLELIKELLLRGEGASFIVRSAVEKELSQGILKEIKISDITLSMETNIVFLDEKRLSKIARAFINVVLKKDEKMFH